MRSLVETFDLTKRYGEVLALNDLNIQIPSGAIGLLGPNGAGKTTLLKILLSLTPTTLGSATVLSKDINSQGLEIRQRIGYMPETDCLIPDMNAVTYLTYLGRLSGLSKNDAIQRTHEALHYVRLGDERYRLISTYSVGMKQKVKLAQALVHDPELIFLDEPTIGLDPLGRVDMLELIRGIVNEQGKSIVLSSHILPDVEHVCEHVVILNQGELLRQGDIEALLRLENPDIIVRVRGDRDGLVKMLDKNGLTVVLMKNCIAIKNEPAAIDVLIKTVAEMNIQLRYLGEGTRTLEELFVNLLGEKEAKT